MDIGIGLPSTIPGADRDQNLAWARRADERGFSTLGVIDRIVYANLEPLIALAAAAGVTERIRLTSSIVIGPYRNTALLAKQAASLDVLSGGRLTVGIAPGGRPDDFEAAGVDFRARGRLFDDQLAELKRIWSGDEIGPAAEREGGPELIVGGYVDAAFRRTTRYGDGWIAGGRPPDDVARGGEAVRQAWEAAGRAGKPRLLGLAYFALGPGGGGRLPEALLRLAGRHGRGDRGQRRHRPRDREAVRGRLRRRRAGRAHPLPLLARARPGRSPGGRGALASAGL